MKHFVLVHGAWHGSWCWEKVIPLIQQQGHIITAPVLPGHEPPGDMNKPVTLEQYTTFITNLLNQIPDQVILVGHSMAGAVISEVAEKIPDKIERLVYLAGYLLKDGQTILEIAEQDKKGIVLPNLNYSRNKKFATVKDEIISEAFYGGCTEADVEMAKSKLVPQSLQPLSTPIHITPQRWGNVPRSYIECLHDMAITVEMQRQMQADLPCGNVISMNTSHSPFFSSPDQLAEIILNHV